MKKIQQVSETMYLEEELASQISSETHFSSETK
jgi:hypothetical protein